MTTTLHYGSREARPAHIGLCLTSREDVAASYGDIIVSVALDLTGLVVAEVAGYDRDENCAVGDTDEERTRLASEGVDVITYQDEDVRGVASQTWRLISARAVAAVAVAS